ncbi:MAG: hypothetical protein GKR99_11770 [Rhodobacteraceae bacterium]|nr:hypothetical protein [Paracoccaceae bacterium]
MQDVFVDPNTDAATLQGIIDAAVGETTIHLAAGTFVFNRTVVIDRDDISLVGAGSAQTTIIAHPTLGNAPAIQLGHALHHPQIGDTYELAAPARAGATAAVLGQGHGAQVGDYLYFTQENTAAFFAEIGDQVWQQDKNLRTTLTKVTVVQGNRVEFETPLAFDFDPAYTTVEDRQIIDGNTLSGITIRGGWGTAEASDFSNTAPQAMGSTMIMIGGTANATLFDISIQDAASHGITVADSTGLTARDITIDGAVNKGIGGNGYGLWIRDVQDSSFRDLTIMDMRHAVTFASYTSATGNDLHVAKTNRDINFHGGRDQHNTVVVDSSIRSGPEEGYLAPTLFVNEGTNYGAPTEAAANLVTFRIVDGTIRAETVTAHEYGATLHLKGGPDTAITGPGNDYVDLGAGDDTARTSVGYDSLIGGPGEGTAIFAASLNAYATRWEGATLIVETGSARTRLSEFEWVVFDDKTFGFASVETRSAHALESWVDTGGAGLAHVTGGNGWERIWVGTSSQMGDKLNAIALLGGDDLDIFGNDLRNHALGNSGANRIEGAGGNDRLVGLMGDDVLLGGDGNDSLVGGPGDDVLVGGNGQDDLIGGTGADTFVATQGRNIVRDFNLDEGDEFIFNSDRTNSLAPALAAHLAGTNTGSAFSFETVWIDGTQSVQITALNAEALILFDTTWDDFF